MKPKNRTPKPSAAIVRWKSTAGQAAFHSHFQRINPPGNLQAICHLDSVFGPRLAIGFRAANP